MQNAIAVSGRLVQGVPLWSARCVGHVTVMGWVMEEKRRHYQWKTDKETLGAERRATSSELSPSRWSLLEYPVVPP